MSNPELSIVIPVYNEEESLPHLLGELVPALEATGRTFEIICVDDGSQDNSFAELKKLRQQEPRVRVVRFRRNFGQTAAFAAGFDRAQGEIVITMDADLQNDPRDIPKLLDKMAEGYDVVSGWRVDRWKEGLRPLLTRKLPSMTANWLISTGTGVYLHDYGCSLKAYRREVVKNIRLYGDLHRFVPAIASYYGVTVAEVPVNYRSRQFGTSKYGLGRVVRVILDLLTVRFLLSYSTRPIQIFGLLGLLTFGLGFVIGLYLTFIKLVYGAALAERPMLLLSILLIMLGVQLITMGLLGELVVRTYHESQNKPIYAVREELG
ncbi:MAG: glycosyltransferase [Chloroflexi bacterium]|nr:MAG: glycosyltransferase [Chloroflexota bacterium]